MSIWHRRVIADRRHALTDQNTATAQSAIILSSELPERLLRWYDWNARALPWRRDKDPYRVWVSEIMLQQTGVDVVLRYYPRFLEAFPTVRALAEADESKLLKLWEGLGYYARARNMRKAARVIAESFGGSFPETYEGLRRLPGVGEYTAGAVASICFELPTPAVDGNVLRVAARLTSLITPLTDADKKQVTESLREIYPPKRCGDFTQSLMELGAVICIPNGQPKCEICPAAGLCSAYRDGKAGTIPVKTQKPPKKAFELTVFLLTCGGRIALRRREEGGLLGGMWELPNVPGHLSDTEALAQAASWGVCPAELLSSMRRGHVFTHLRWDMLCYAIDCRDMTADGLVWVSHSELERAYALPTAFRKFIGGDS